MQLLKRVLRGWPGVDATGKTQRSSSNGEKSHEKQVPPEDIVAASTALVAEGRYAESHSLLRAALARHPQYPELLFARASTLFSWGRYREGCDALLSLEKLGFSNGPFYMKLGWACFWTGDLEESERCMRNAVKAQPDDWNVHFALATTLHARRKTEEARGVFENALELCPDNEYCVANLLVCEVELNRLDVAEDLARRVIAIDDTSAIAWSNLGVVLDHQDRYTEAIAAFMRAEELSLVGREIQPDYVNFAVCLLRAAKTREGIAFLECKLPEYPSVQAHSHYALSLLLSGRMAEGWEQYEFRWVDGPLKATRSNFIKPAWDGQDIRGKTILLRSEQGYGDFIQFIRYAPHIKALGATVLLYLPEMVRKLAKDFDGIDHILLADAPYPPFDFFVNLMSLPRIFGTDVTSIPADVPYLHVEVERATYWKERLGDGEGLKVGVAWAGSPSHLRDQFRSIPLDTLCPLGAVCGVRYFSLQKGPAAAQLDAVAESLPMVNLESELADFVDTAAAISQLDLVICVDTSVAHLAGALGKPVWLLLPNPCDWRWLEDRGDSPWYPTMRIFRQSTGGDWTNVVRRVADTLQEFVSDRPHDVQCEAISTAAPLYARPPLHPRATPAPRNNGLSAAAYTKVGTLQYWPDQHLVGPSIRYYGEYIQRQLDLLGRVIQSGTTVMEVGSGIGAHAVYLGKLIGPTGHLMIYEPRPTMQRVLRQNLATNEITNITIMRRAANASMCLGPFAIQASDAPQSNDSLHTTDGEFETIDELYLEKLHCLKINEHDQPLAVLRGAVDTLWRLRPILFVAATDENDLDALSAIGHECSYRTWRMDTPLFNSANFNLRDNDIFPGESALALFAVPEEVEMDIVLDCCVELF